MISFNSPEFKVGALVVVVSSLIGIMSLKVAEGPGIFGGSREYWFEVPDAGGLVKKSSVKMAGIQVGIIDDIKLKDGKAQVYIQIEKDASLTTSAKVELKTDGILGDKHVELVQGKIGDPPLQDGAQIQAFTEGGSLDKVMSQVGKITDSLSKLADTLNKAASGDGDSTSAVGRIVLNLEKLTKDLSDMSGENKDKINEIVANVHRITENLDTFIGEDSPTGFKAAWQKAIDSLSRIDTSLKNIEEITDKVNRGEGTIGRLINDDETVNELNTAIGNVNNFLGGASEMETSVDFHSEFLTNADAAKSFVALKIQPGPDRYYELGIVDSPEGVTSETISRTTVDDADPVTTRNRTTYKNKIKFNALFAKNFYDFTIKGGIMESSGGAGFDYNMFRKKLRLSFEIFDFDDPYMRAYLRYNFFKGVYVIGGGDNLASSGDGEASGFIGAGIFITNDDLKMLASKASF